MFAAQKSENYGPIDDHQAREHFVPEIGRYTFSIVFRHPEDDQLSKAFAWAHSRCDCPSATATIKLILTLEFAEHFRASPKDFGAAFARLVVDSGSNAANSNPWSRWPGTGLMVSIDPTICEHLVSERNEKSLRTLRDSFRRALMRGIRRVAEEHPAAVEFLASFRSTLREHAPNAEPE